MHKPAATSRLAIPFLKRPSHMVLETTRTPVPGKREAAPDSMSKTACKREVVRL
jgi:hypothetical protein